MFLFDRFGCKLTFEYIRKVSEMHFKIKWVAGLGQHIMMGNYKVQYLIKVHLKDRKLKTKFTFQYFLNLYQNGTLLFVRMEKFANAALRIFGTIANHNSVILLCILQRQHYYVC